METFSFIDKETGDSIQTGSANDYSLSSSTTRAISNFHLVGPAVVAPLNLGHDYVNNDNLYTPNQILPGKSPFAYEISPTSAAIYDSPTEFSSINSSSTFSTIDVSTPCPKKPRILAPTHFYVPHECFLSLKSGIDHCLSQRAELVFSSFPKKHMWKCKYLEGSQSREMHVHCFWDTMRKSHLVEVKRVQGDGLFPQYTDLTTVLRQGLLPPTATSSSSSSDAKRPRPVPCIPPSFLSRNTLESTTTATTTTTEHVCDPATFQATLQSFFHMAQNAYNEPRLEAVKMLCDTLARPSSHVFWQSSENSTAAAVAIGIQTVLLETLYLFLRDSHAPVMEFAVVATHVLLDKCPASRCWLMTFREGALVESLIKHIRNCEKSPSHSIIIRNHHIVENEADGTNNNNYNQGDNETAGEEFYQYAHMRRLAGKALHLMIVDTCCAKCCGRVSVTATSTSSVTAADGNSECKEHRRKLMARILQRAGHFSQENWLEYIKSLEDDVLRESVLSVAQCY